MEINEINKALYELAFIQNGEYGYHECSWKPSIDERNIENIIESVNGEILPATPLGYRDYKLSRLQGLANIIAQYPCIKLTYEELYNINKNSNKLKQYDKIVVNNKPYVVTGDDVDQNCFYIVDENNERYFVNYVTIE